MKSKLHILLIEDQMELSANIGRYLESQDIIMDYATDGHMGLDLALNHNFDVIILDLMLPGIDGLKICETLRAKQAQRTPIIMLTARDTLQDKVLGFQQGADDYLTKPFALQELHVRCLALAQRHQLNQNSVIELGDLEIDRKRQQVKRAGVKVTLHSMSYNILLILAEHHPKIVTRSELIQKLWGDSPTESDSIRSHIYHLRQSLDKPFDQPLINTIHGVGFSLNIKEQES